ncbi:MAG: phospho-N-acetylmuramoyl-pentapeptide-transferase [Eubacteriales bacterium]|nr:phospho-N-acetylmuramoyl-pentapeptide-transferase [Eubacteriales bacterium]MDD4541683.1 phospho-N-acetylmuramoyl-pentapeptide-transferase [Eubacteriales bacterium]
MDKLGLTLSSASLFMGNKVLTGQSMLLWALIMFLATVLTGTIGLPLIKKLNIGQRVREDGPKSHYSKTGTPTFGALFFLIPLFLIGFAAALIYKGMLTFGMILLFMLLFAIVGFIDDYIKVRISREGLSVKQKTVMLGLLSILASGCFVYVLPGAFILIPFTMEKVVLTGIGQFIYFLILIPFLFYMSNSVNITDGLDGLLSGLMAIACLFLTIAARVLAFAGLLAPQSQFLPILIIAGCLAFLFFNRHPARIFMGDTGSQSLGIGFTLLTVSMGTPYLAVMIGFVFFFEGLSVLMQTFYFRRTGGKRIFRMAPIHHHFELSGWPEQKVVFVFYLAGIISGLVGLLFIYGAY